MEQANLIKQLTCTKHQFSQRDLIHLTGFTDQGRICSLCVAKNQIPFQEILSIQELFTKNKDELLSTYPPFKSQQIRELIERFTQENSPKEKIDEFFQQLRLDVEEAIQIAENKAKQQLIKFLEGEQILIQEINKFSEIDQLKEHLISGSSENLNAFLKSKWSTAERNDEIIQKLIDQNQIPHLQFNLDEKQLEISTIVDSIKNFPLFKEQKSYVSQSNKETETPLNIQSNKGEKILRHSIIHTSNLIKSLFSDSQKLTINKTLNGSLQLINNTSNYICGQAYLDFVLNPKSSYTIRLCYSPKGNYSSFFFGLVSDHNQETGWGNHISKLSYHNGNSKFGISQYVKGPNINSGQRKNQKEEFEVHISLEQIVLEVASLPDYESILTLDDPNKIQSDTSYRFFIFIGYQGDMIEISEIIESNKYSSFII